MEKINELIEKTKDILKISEEKVIIRRTVVTHEAELDWDNQTKSWIICYQNKPSDFSIIHELGHIYFAKNIINCLDFAIPRYNNIGIDKSILPLLNNLVDNFINYNLIKFDELYPFYCDKIYSYLDNLDNFKIQINKVKDINTLLSWLLLFYIDYNYILKDADRKFRISEIKDLLNCMENNLIQFKPLMDNNKLKNLTEKLDLFQSEKLTRKPIRIISFFIMVLLSLNLWNKTILKTQMKLIFPRAFKKKKIT